MSTATAPTNTTSTKTYERTAKEEREYNLNINGDKPLVEIKGTNTYPIKGWLFTLGGRWNKETQSWFVPDHTYHAAQTKADELTKAKAEQDAKKGQPKAAAPVKAPEAKASPTAPKATPVATAPAPVSNPAPAAPVSTDRVVFRINNLHKATSDLLATVTDEKVKEALELAVASLTLAGEHALAAAK